MTIEDTVAFAKAAKAQGVDVVDCSSGGNTPVPPKLSPGYQVPYAEAVRQGADIATMAVGLILDAKLAEEIVSSGKADLIALARPALEDPNFAIHASAALTGNAGLWSGADARQERPGPPGPVAEAYGKGLERSPTASARPLRRLRRHLPRFATLSWEEKRSAD